VEGDDSREERGGGSGDDRGSDLAGGETTRITREGQVTIPKRFREEFGLEEGDELLREKTEDGITAFGEPRLSSRATRNL
jgi:AbrB family looped-hinge helix DNA binding protein